jgi:hypothetical protein
MLLYLTKESDSGYKIFNVSKRKSGLLIFCFIFTSIFCPAQETNGGFWDGLATVAPFGKPFWADMHSTLIRVEIAYAKNSPDYDWGNFDTKNRFFVFANLGVDLPIWSGTFVDGKYGLSITMPFMIDVWFDRFEWETSPIINASYRFGAFDIGFIYRLDSPLTVFPHFNIYNWTLKLSSFKHESTHLGDELIIYRKDIEMPITRVDVAYNFAELVFTLNDPDRKPHSNHGLKLGFLFHYEFKNGWYTVMEWDGSTDKVKRSQIPFELYAQYQYQSPLFSRGFQIIASFEYRLRERYKYPYAYGVIDDSNDRKILYSTGKSNFANCFDFLVGIRYDSQKFNYFSKIGIAARYYYGLNPYGQFRSMPNYHQFGLMAFFE